jgi:hypothetical protein
LQQLTATEPERCFAAASFFRKEFVAAGNVLCALGKSSQCFMAVHQEFKSICVPFDA